jgi:hypothetical protein
MMGRAYITLAVAVAIFLQLGMSSFYWLVDARLAVALRPTVEMVVLTLCALLLPPRRALFAVLSAAVSLTLLVALGQGLLQRQFGRDFVLVLDLPYLAALLKLLFDNQPPAWFLVEMLALLSAAAASVLAPYAGLRLLGRLQPRRKLVLGGAVLAYFAVGAAFGGVHRPVTLEVADQLALLVRRQSTLAATARILESEAHTPARLAKLPSRITVYVVESYGAAMPREPIAAIGDQLAKNGWHVRSKWLRSPVFGGGSWLADASLWCGVRIDNQKRYASLFQSTVRCVPRVLADAGYHTLLAAANTEEHDAARDGLLGFGTTVFHRDFGYAGPRFGWSNMPDQFVIDSVERRGVPPVFEAAVLTSSHTPWAVVPPLVDETSLGDGSDFARRPATRFDNQLLGGDERVAGYRASVEYSLAAIARHLARVSDDRLVVIVGDHQPRSPVGDRWHEPYTVPVHVLSRSTAELDRLAPLGYTDGMVPPPGEPTGFERLLPELVGDSP